MGPYPRETKQPVPRTYDFLKPGILRSYELLWSWSSRCVGTVVRSNIQFSQSNRLCARLRFTQKGVGISTLRSTMSGLNDVPHANTPWLGRVFIQQSSSRRLHPTLPSCCIRPLTSFTQ